MTHLVTGGAGFIGSHLSERLLERGDSVVVVDDLSSGREEWVPDGANFHERDLTRKDALSGVLTDEVDRLWHCAASKQVDVDRPHEQFRGNTEMTLTVLSAMEAHGIDELVYTSSSTVYGEAPRPTPEDYGPLEPISVYGASKLADEGLVSAYAHSHGVEAWVFRFANIVGPRLRGAVIPDFIDKLAADPESLEILGNGKQEKSYMHVDDCVDAMMHVVDSFEGPVEIVNLGTRTTTSVDAIADIVSEEMDLAPTYEYTGGKRGWTGDVPKMRLDIKQLLGSGWSPKYSSDRAVQRCVREILDEFGLE